MGVARSTPGPTAASLCAPFIRGPSTDGAQGNRAAEGAGLWAESITNVAWLNTTFDANVALNGGAAFVGAGASSGTYVPGAHTTLGSNIAFQSCTFSNNVATLGTGGAITIAQGGRATISGGTFSSNSAALGGAVYTTSGGTLTVFDATFTGNSATNLGGGMCVLAVVDFVS